MTPMLALTLFLAIAGTEQIAERSAWQDCLLTYAQTESVGHKTAARIAVEGLGACGGERQVYVKALVRRFQATASAGNSAIDQAIAQAEADQKAAVRRVIAFVLRNRQR